MEMIKNVANKIAGAVSFPALGEEEDINKAKDIIGDDATVFAALRAPPEFYTLKLYDYCRLLCIPWYGLPIIGASKAMENSLYIVSDKEVKVHVDPFKPPLCTSAPTRDLPKMDFKDVTNVKIVREGGGCVDPREKTGIVFEGSGIKFFIKDPEKLEEIIQQAKKLAGGAKEAVATINSLQEGQNPAQDEGQSAPQ